MADLDVMKGALRAAEECEFRLWEVSSALTAIGQLATRAEKSHGPELKGEELACLLNVLSRSLRHTQETLAMSLDAIGRAAA